MLTLDQLHKVAEAVGHRIVETPPSTLHPRYHLVGNAGVIIDQYPYLTDLSRALADIVERETDIEKVQKLCTSYLMVRGEDKRDSHEKHEGLIGCKENITFLAAMLRDTGEPGPTETVAPITKVWHDGVWVTTQDGVAAFVKAEIDKAIAEHEGTRHKQRGIDLDDYERQCKLLRDRREAK